MKGKEKCRILKEIRQRIADENDIPYVTRECHFQGECRGTCPRCESELRYLEQQLAFRAAMGKRVAVAALCAGMTVFATGCTSSGGAADSGGESDLSGAVDVVETETSGSSSGTESSIDTGSSGANTASTACTSTTAVETEPSGNGSTEEVIELTGEVDYSYDPEPDVMIDDVLTGEIPPLEEEVTVHE